MKRGDGQRCHGFRSDDRRYAFCAREEYAGDLELHDSVPDCYRHSLTKPCGCGVTAHIEPVAVRSTVNRGRKQIEATYQYHDESDRLLFVKERYRFDDGGKDFGFRQPNGRGDWTWNLQGVRRVLYRLPELIRAPALAPVFIVEGEKCAEAMREEGVVATCNLDGAPGAGQRPKWKPEYNEHLRGRDVIILPDNDEPGRHHGTQVAQSLYGTAARIRVVELPGLPENGDIVDWLDAGRSVEELLEIAEATADWSPSTSTHSRLKLVTLSSIDEEAVEWLWYTRLGRGKATVLDGDPGEGKSTITVDTAARVSTGAPMPGETTRREPADVIILSAEDGLADTIVPRIRAAGGDASRIHTVAPEGGGDIAIPRDLDQLEPLIREKRVALLIVDPLVCFLEGKGDEQAVRRALTPLHHLAERTGVAVLAVRHFRKQGGKAIHAGAGSIGTIGAARVGLIAGKDRDGNQLLAISKGNVAPQRDWKTLRYQLVDAGGAARVEWVGESSVTADEIADADATGPSKPELALRWLRAQLAHGEVAVSDLEERAEAAGLSWTGAVNRARRELGISKANKTAVKRGGAWFWSLPAESKAGEDEQAGG